MGKRVKFNEAIMFHAYSPKEEKYMEHSLVLERSVAEGVHDIILVCGPDGKTMLSGNAEVLADVFSRAAIIWGTERREEI
jgi:hypothetical protein